MPRVSVIDLLARPGQYDGKRVRVVGVLSTGEFRGGFVRSDQRAERGNCLGSAQQTLAGRRHPAREQPIVGGMLSRLLWICLAGALGTGVRYLLGVWASERFGSAFPYGTLLVNVVGCFLIGAIMQVALSFATFPPTLRLALTTGLLGGLTTYSAFAYETVALARANSHQSALINFAVTTVACFTAVVLGILMGQLLAARATG